jgi:non-ribosomal peptide synthetase component F
MIEEMDTQIPNVSTAWQLWYVDMFDRDAPRALERTGVNIIQGLYHLWLCTLTDGILDNGNASFSYFHLTWASSPSAHVDVAVNPFDNRALLKLRGWIGLVSQVSENKSGQVNQRKDVILWRLAQLHFDLLQNSSRWKLSGVDWGAEARELLARIELISDPEEL